jgi:RNA polymerase sigma-70 factor, ECF subfamily
MSEKEFDSTVIGFRSDLISLARTLTGDRDMALDLVQDTYVKIFSFKDRLITYESLKGGVIRILKNTFVNNYRHDLLIPYDPLGDDMKKYPSVEDTYSVKEISGIVALLNHTLRPSFQLHIKGYTYKEISAKLRMPVGTIKSNVCRARPKIKKELIKQGYR